MSTVAARQRGWPMPRPLPRTVIPLAGETTDSYLHRLASANHLDAGLLLAYLCVPRPRSLRHLTLERLAAAAGQPLERITRLHRSAPGERTRHLHGHLTHIRPACHRCAARRGALDEVALCHYPDHLTVCHRHQLWIGRGALSHAEQHDLSQMPEILMAQRRHHRLLLRYDRNLIACFRASGEKFWRHRLRLPAGATPEQRRRLAQLDPALIVDQGHGIPYAKLHCTAVTISTYPEVIQHVEDDLARYATPWPPRQHRHATASRTPITAMFAAVGPSPAG